MVSDSSLRVAIIGAGYVGLSTAVALGLAGHKVSVLERNQQKRELLQSGIAPFQEPMLEECLAFLNNNLEFPTNPVPVLAEADIVIIAVGTPPTPTGNADLTQVYAAAFEIAEAVGAALALIVVKSTVPVGTCAALETYLQQLAPRGSFSVASNPEFLSQGKAIRDAVFPDRIVIGTNDTRAKMRLEALYTPLAETLYRMPVSLELYRPKTKIPIIWTSLESAELAKYAANAFLAMKISFANEIANVCDTVGANIDQVMNVIGHDQRIGNSFLRAGLGYGGSCFPKDTRALSQLSVISGYDFRLLRAVIEVNNTQRLRVLDRLEEILKGLRDKHVAILGLTFKPGTDDLRESLGIQIALELQARGCKVSAHDPVAALRARLELPTAIFVSDSLEAVLKNTHAAILVTEWEAYITANWVSLGAVMQQRLMLDGRNALDPQELQQAGFWYVGIGRPSASEHQKTADLELE